MLLKIKLKDIWVCKSLGLSDFYPRGPDSEEQGANVIKKLQARVYYAQRFFLCVCLPVGRQDVLKKFQLLSGAR